MNTKIKYFLADTAKSLYSLVALAILITVLAQPIEVKGAENGLEAQSDVFEQYFTDTESMQTNSYFSAPARQASQLTGVAGKQEKLIAGKTLSPCGRSPEGGRPMRFICESNERIVKNVFILPSEPPVKPDKVVEVVMTAYTSTPDQTDDSPFIAASGKRVYDGMLAANWLPFGTQVKIPELYGDKIFTVDDRMNRRYGYGRMDIWLDATKTEARKFGVKRLTVEVYYQDKTEKKVEKLVLAR